MNNEWFVDIANQAVKITLYVSSPMLLGALLMGILISLFQAITQINEQTLSFVPKILVIVGSMVIFAPWISSTLVDFTKELILNIPKIISSY